MDAFEQIVAMLIEREGYWTRLSYRVELTAEDKAEIRRPSCPRWELDLIALRPQENALLVLECKSLLDSIGVQARDLVEDDDSDAKGRYKLFTEPTLRRVVMRRLQTQLQQERLACEGLKLRLGMAVGKFKNAANRNQLKELFGNNDWLLLDEDWLRAGLRSAASAGYENDIAFVVSKLLLRE
jgi:hypothetical protein